MPRGYKQPVHMMDKDDGKILITYKSISEAEYAWDINQTNIVQCCKGTRLTAGGFRWAYAKEG